MHEMRSALLSSRTASRLSTPAPTRRIAWPWRPDAGTSIEAQRRELSAPATLSQKRQALADLLA